MKVADDTFYRISECEWVKELNKNELKCNLSFPIYQILLTLKEFLLKLVSECAILLSINSKK